MNTELSTRRDQRGMVTAEAALVLPLLTVLAVGLVYLVALGIAQVQVVDAARDAARGLARGGSEQAAREHVQTTVPGSTTMSVETSGDRIDVVVTSELRALDGLIRLPAVTLHADASVEAEGDGES